MGVAILSNMGPMGLGLLETADDRMMRRAGAYLSLELNTSGPSEFAETLLYLIGRIETQNEDIRCMAAKLEKHGGKGQ